MPTIHFACPRCGRKFESPQAGATILCPCGQLLHAPQTALPGVNPTQATQRVATSWNRLLLVGGVLAAMGMFFVSFAALLIFLVFFLNKNTDSPTVAQADTTVSTSAKGSKKKGTAINAGKQGSASPSREPLGKAFDAIGSRERLEDIKAVRIVCKANFVGGTHINDITLTWQSTKRFKFIEKNETAGTETGFVLKGDQGWQWFGPQVPGHSQASGRLGREIYAVFQRVD
jgi:hypothetical protein